MAAFTVRYFTNSATMLATKKDKVNSEKISKFIILNQIMTTMNNKPEKCSVCGVTIKDDLVKFSFGQPGSRNRLYARVCQFIKNNPDKFSKCINSGVDEEALTKDDHYD